MTTSTVSLKSASERDAPSNTEPTPAHNRSRERDNTAIPGYDLIRRIKQKQLRSGENSETGLLQRLKLTRQYWNSFCNGTRPITTLVANKRRREFLAQYLGCSQLEIRILAGDIEPEELVAAESDTLWLEIEKMQNDSRWGMLAPSTQQEWEDLPMKARILIVSMYRTITEKDLQKVVAEAQEKPAAPQTIESL